MEHHLSNPLGYEPLPKLLRSFAEYRVLLFGMLMVVMMIWRPRGLVRTSRSGVALRKGVAP